MDYRQSGVDIDAGDRLVENIEHGRFERSLSGLTAAGALVTGAEIWLEHDRASFANRMMWVPVMLTPLVAAAGGRPSVHLFRNNGDGRFTDITSEAGLSLDAPIVAAIPTDYDNRRDIDIMLAGPAAGPMAPIASR